MQSSIYINCYKIKIENDTLKTSVDENKSPSQNNHETQENSKRTLYSELYILKQAFKKTLSLVFKH